MISGNYSTIAGSGKKEVIQLEIQETMEVLGSVLPLVNLLHAPEPSPGPIRMEIFGSLAEHTMEQIDIDIFSMISGNMRSAPINGPGCLEIAAWINLTVLRIIRVQDPVAQPGSTQMETSGSLEDFSLSCL